MEDGDGYASIETCLLYKCKYYIDCSIHLPLAPPTSGIPRRKCGPLTEKGYLSQQDVHQIKVYQLLFESCSELNRVFNLIGTF